MTKITNTTCSELFALKEAFKSVTIYLDKSEPQDIVFYYLWSRNNIKGLKNRIQALDDEPRTIVINRLIEDIKIETVHNLVYMDELNWKSSRKKFAQYFFPFKKGLKQVAVTGTNGKTTSCFLGMQMANHVGLDSLYIGTLGIYKDGIKIEDHYLTTPNLIDYRRIVNQYQDEVDIVWVEASSHGIHQKRLEGIEFDALGWTSFSLDHLDYHKTSEEYFQAKKDLFLQVKDQDHDRIRLGEIIQGLENIKVAKPIDHQVNNHAFLQVDHNQKNLSLVCHLLEVLGQKVTESQLKSFEPQVPGRFHILNDSFVIDYAHTPDALERLLEECSQIWPNRQIVTVFGCGGDRDRSKRSIMTKIACRKSDWVVITEDNPRSESLEQIFKDMTQGLEFENYMMIPNRKEALDKVFNDFQKNPDSNNLIIIAGKGEENFITRDKSHPKHKEQHNDLNYIKGLYDIS